MPFSLCFEPKATALQEKQTLNKFSSFSTLFWQGVRRQPKLSRERREEKDEIENGSQTQLNGHRRQPLHSSKHLKSHYHRVLQKRLIGACSLLHSLSMHLFRAGWVCKHHKPLISSSSSSSSSISPLSQKVYYWLDKQQIDTYAVGFTWQQACCWLDDDVLAEKPNIFVFCPPSWTPQKA